MIAVCSADKVSSEARTPGGRGAERSLTGSLLVCSLWDITRTSAPVSISIRARMA
ncbi:hypothetical protein AB0L44_04770 [Nonomuraea wenchangensis]|uniref:hypothetical protein n=1 Tax=Nonomuraea wenchangensis TaxID=568860 RepID=UPI00342BB932